jgi:hypothetical protein
MAWHFSSKLLKFLMGIPDGIILRPPLFSKDQAVDALSKFLIFAISP